MLLDSSTKHKCKGLTRVGDLSMESNTRHSWFSSCECLGSENVPLLQIEQVLLEPKMLTLTDNTLVEMAPRG